MPMSDNTPIKRRKMDQSCQTREHNCMNKSDAGSFNSTPIRLCQQNKLINYRVILARRGYLVHETLGSGSYSKVKRAVNMFCNGELTAVKIIDRQKAPNDYLERFLPRELEIWPHLRHQNLLQLQEVFQDGRRVYMITDFAPNGDVLKYIQDHGAVTEGQSKTWMWQICDAVKYMHNLNFAHRDLKLENLLLDSGMNIKVADFGFVRKNAGNSLSKTYCGSKSYAAPEILIGKPYKPKKSDVWALGVILYIIVTGKMPFDETKGTRHILKEQEALKLRWPKHNPVSEDLQLLVTNMFTWFFEKRPDIFSVMEDPWFMMKDEPVSNESSNTSLELKAGEPFLSP